MNRGLVGLFLASCVSCSAVYPEVKTPIRHVEPVESDAFSMATGEPLDAPGGRPPGTSEEETSPGAAKEPAPTPEFDPVIDAPPPDDVYYIYVQDAFVPARTRDGRPWEGGGPNTYARLLWGKRKILETPIQAGTREPTWPNQTKSNVQIDAGAELTLQLWHDDPIKDHPLCHVTVRNLDSIREGGRNEFDCDGGARITLAVKKARAVMGLGFYYELRGSDGVRLTKILPRSPSERLGLSRGDQILAINGNPVSKMDGLQVQSTINTNSRSGLTLKLKSHSGTRELKIKEGPIYPLQGEGIPLTAK